MKIEVKETTEEKFPAIFKDKIGNVWIWADKYSYICFDKDDSVEIDVSNDRFEFDFDELNDTWKFVRVQGTITITV